MVLQSPGTSVSGFVGSGFWVRIPYLSGRFPKLGVPLLGGPYDKDPANWGTISGSPIFGNSHLGLLEAFGF